MFAQSCSTDERWGSGVWIGQREREREGRRGVTGWRWDQAWSSEDGGGEDAALRMPLGPQEPSGPSPSPPHTLREGEGQVAGAGGMAWTSTSGGTRLAIWAPLKH